MRQLTWLAGCLIVVIGACTGASATASAPGPVPSVVTNATSAPSEVAVVNSYYRDIVGREYRRAFGYLAADATGWDGKKLTLRSFLQLARMLDGMGGPVTRFSSALAPSGIVMTLYRARYGPYHAHLRMVRTAHGWAIASLDRI